MQVYYHILDISPRASDEDVRRAYHAMALRWHPDRNPHARAQAEDMFARVNHAYHMLRTAPQRRAYNRHLIRAMGLDRPAVPAPVRPRKKNRVMAFLSGTVEIFWPFTFRREIRHG